jgi:hypothetical protein
MSGETETVGGGGALMLAMTDLFVSATATLLVVLALASPYPPKPFPVQADLVMLCPESGSATKEFVLFPASAVTFREKGGTLRPVTTIHFVRNHRELSRIVSAMKLPAKHMLTIALAPSTGRPLTANCFATVSRQLVSRYNHQNNTSREISVPILALQVIDRPIRLDATNEW